MASESNAAVAPAAPPAEAPAEIEVKTFVRKNGSIARVAKKVKPKAEAAASQAQPGPSRPEEKREAKSTHGPWPWVAVLSVLAGISGGLVFRARMKRAR